MPSNDDPGTNAVVEALASGGPVVVTDRPGVATYQPADASVRFSPGPSDLRDLGVNYLFLKAECNPYSDRDRAFEQAALDLSGEVVYERHVFRTGFRCANIDTALVRVGYE